MHPSLEKIWKRYEAGEIEGMDREIINLLSKHNINIRKDDGDMVQINLSIPKILINDLVIGLRYIKKDKTFTEDHFLCKTDVATGNFVINPYYGKYLEEFLEEYKGTHKYQLSQNNLYSNERVVTMVNTISHTFKMNWP